MNLAGEAYRVMYCKKSDKKRKTYQDGNLRVMSECMTLIDDDGKEIYKKKGSVIAVQVGVDMMLGGFELQIEEVIPLSIKTTMAEGYVSHTSSISNVSYSSAPKPSSSMKINSFAQKGVKLDPPCLKVVEKIDTKIVKKFVSGGSLPAYNKGVSAPFKPLQSSEKSNTIVQLGSVDGDSLNTSAVSTTTSSSSSSSSSSSR
jgi:hypothetical protein